MKKFPTFLLLAWRNSWRNRKRSLIAIASVVFAVFLATGMASMQLGQHAAMVNGVVMQSTGFIQLQHPEFWDTRSLDHSLPAWIEDTLSSWDDPSITLLVPRIETGVLISKDSVTKISPLVGIDPAREHAMTGLEKKIIAGRYLSDSSSGIMISEGLARRLQVSIGDSLVLFGSGFHGSTAAAILPVEGILLFPIPQMNQAMIYMNLSTIRSFADMSTQLSTVSLMISQPDELDAVADRLREHSGDRVSVKTWRELMPELVEAIYADRAGSVIMLGILYIVIGFGIFGTFVMMTQERIREFGILMAVGMKKGELMTVQILEIILITGTGMVAGLLCSLAMIFWFQANPITLSGEMADMMWRYGMEPIIPFSTESLVFSFNISSVGFIALLCTIYPILVIRSLKPVEAMRR